jgi:hypothetical protein
MIRVANSDAISEINVRIELTTQGELGSGFRSFPLYVTTTGTRVLSPETNAVTVP